MEGKDQYRDHQNQPQGHTGECCGQSPNSGKGQGHSDLNASQQTPPHVKKQSQKTTAIALGILMFVSLGLVGFEVVVDKKKEMDNPTVRGSKSLLILSQEKKKDSAGIIASTSPRWTNTNVKETEALKETNRLQSEKIKELKRQLAESNMKLQDVKAHLFTKGDPTDRARLAEICQQLADQERKNQDTMQKIALLEKEKEYNLQKINRMEHTIDALASMTDTQQATKEQAILTFQEQIERLQDSAKAEREELQRTIADLEEIQHELRDSLASRIESIKNLEEEVNWQYGVLQEKDNEIQSQAKLFRSSEKRLNQHVQDLVSALELETIKNKNIKSDLEVAEARGLAQNEYTRSLEEKIRRKEERFAQTDSQRKQAALALVREYQDLQGLLNVYAQSHNRLSTNQKKLKELVKTEETKAAQFQKELGLALARLDAEEQKEFCLEEELHKASSQVLTMQQELKRKDALINAREQDLETLMYSNASLKDQLHEKINQLTTSLDEEHLKLLKRENVVRDLTINLELERTKSQELEHKLAQALFEHKNETEKVAALESELGRKAEALAALENRVQDKEFEINDLKLQVKEMARSYEQEKNRTQELHRALVAALDESEKEQTQIGALRKSLEENTDTMSFLQNRMSEKQNIIKDLQIRLNEMEKQLTGEKKRNQELVTNLASTLADKDSSQEKAHFLEQDLQSNSMKLVNLEDAIADKQNEVRKLLDQVQGLSNDLEAERRTTQGLQYRLETALKDKDAESRKNQTLADTLMQHENEIKNLMREMDQLALKYESEKQKSLTLHDKLAKSLDRQQAQIDMAGGLENMIAKNNQEMAYLQETIKQQRSEIESLNRQINNLGNTLTLEINRSKALKLANDSEKQRIEKLERQLVALKNEQGNLEKQYVERQTVLSDQLETRQKLAKDLQQAATAKSHKGDVAVSEKDAAQHAQSAAAAGFQHVVTKGENLSSISVYYYGTPNRWIDIYNANHKLIPDKDKLEPGITLVIPK